MAMIRWPLPYDHAPNDFEVVGRYIAQTIQMERFIDIILLHDGAQPRDLIRAKLSRKVEDVRLLIERAAGALDEWHDLLDLMLSVARHRNGFAHRMFERGALPSHYGQGVPYKVLSDEELRQQETEAFQASEACRQLVERLTLASLNSDVHFGRHDSYWAQEGRGKNPPR
jgi:hypothetical protein